MRRGTAILALALATILPAAEDTGGTRILCLHALPSSAWSEAVQRGYRLGLDADSHRDLAIAVEHLDERLAADGAYADDWWRLFARRHAGRRFDLILAAGDGAFRTALQRQDSALGGTPVVFSGVETWDPGHGGADRRFTGVMAIPGLDRTLEVGLRLRPNARVLHLISLPTDDPRAQAAPTAPLRREMLRLRPGLGLAQVRADDPTALGLLLARLPEEDLAFVLDPHPQEEAPPRDAAALTVALRRSSAPVLTNSQRLVGLGALGGYCVDGEEQGRAAGRLAQRVLAGAAPGSLPIDADGPNRWIFDRAELARLRIAEDGLPTERLLRGSVPPSGTGIWWGTGGCAVLLAAAIGALRLRRRHRDRIEDGMERSPHPIALLAPDGRVEQVNAAFAECLGPAGLSFPIMAAGVEGVPPQCWEDCLHPGSLPLRRPLVHRCGSPHRHFQLSFSALPSGRILVEGCETTEAMLAATALRECDERFRLLAACLPQAFWVHDWPGLHLRYASPATERVLGRASDELEADPLCWLPTVHPDDRSRIEQTVLAAGSMETTGWRGEFRIQAAGGAIRWIEARAMPIRNQQGDTVSLALLASDISARREIEDRLRAGQRLEAMGQLAGGVAHDFNNQLAAMLGYAELLHKRAEGDARRWTEALVAAAQRSASLTRQLLSFARHAEPAHIPVDMHSLVAEALVLARVGMGSSIQVATRLDAEACQVMGDPGLLQNALLNLCLNARDAMPRGGSLAIATRVARLGTDSEPASPALPTGDYLALSVQDTGVGMPAEILQRLFEPFFTTKPLGKGTGLGLAAVWGVAQGLGGTVTVTSRVDEGSCFTLWLPLIDGATTANPSGPVPAAGLRGAEVLVADDESGVRAVITEQLRLLGCRVHEAGDADEAVRSYERHRPALALIDMVMPAGGGCAAFAGIRASDADARVLVVSGYSPDGEVQRLLDAGAVGFLQKPFSGKDLAKVVANALAAGRVDSGRAGAQRPSP